jgi:hypothetical protein
MTELKLSSLIHWFACCVMLANFNSCAFGKEDAIESLFQNDDSELLFIAGGMDWITTTDNIYVWTPNLINVPMFTVNGIAYGRDMFVAVADWNGSSGVMLSKDGLIWLGPFNPNLGSMLSVTYYNKRFIAGTNGQIYFSEDGIVWFLARQTPLPIIDFAVGNSRIVAIDDSGNGYVSMDGLVWAGPISMNTGGNMMHRVAYGNGLFIAVGDAATTTISRDGFLWVRSPIQPAAGGRISCITYGNGLFVATDDLMMYRWYISKDGISWIKTGYNSNTMHDVIYCGGRYIAVGVGGLVEYSADGIAWQTRTIPTAAMDLNCIICRPGKQ